MKKIILTFLLISAIFKFVSAKNLYVNASIGSDATTYANNSENNPWATIGRAVWGNATRPSSVDNGTPPTSSEAATAGDTVFVASGTYNVTQGSSPGERYLAVYNTANQGTPGNPIVIYAIGEVILESNLSNGGQSLIGSYSREYVEWIGFTVYKQNCTMADEDAPAILWEATGCAIRGNNFVGYYESNPANSNKPLLWFHNATDCIAANNSFTDQRGSAGENHTGITMYNSVNCIIEHNYFENINNALYPKATQYVGAPVQRGIIVRYNWFENCNRGLRTFTMEPSSTQNSKIYQNIFLNISGSAIELLPLANDYRDIDSLYVVNNTIYNCGFGIRFGGGNLFEDVRAYNNIITNSDYAMWSSDGSDGATFKSEYESDYNCWFNNHPSIFYLCSGNYTYLQWQTQFFNGNADANSITLNPQFINPANDSLQLQLSSPCSTGVDILDLDGDSQTDDPVNMGCYVTGNEIIGIDTTGGGSEPPPVTPSTTTSINYIED